MSAFNLRMPKDLKEKLRLAAAVEGRSINAEIIKRLKASFESYRRF